MKAVLVMFKADGKRREFPLKPGTHVIGRQKTCKLRVPLPSVSRRHAELVVTEAGEVTVRDLGSSNGTFRNGSRVEEAVLEPGDELRIGPLDLILADADEADVQPPEKKAAAASLDSGSGSLDLDPVEASTGGDDDAADSGAFLLDDDEDDPLAGLDSDDSVSSANPLDASASASAMAIDLDGDDEDALGSDDSHNTAADAPDSPKTAPKAAASGSAAPAPPAAGLDDDDEDLDDLLANFGKSEDGDDDSGEFDFLADVEILDDDEDDQK